MVSRDPVPESPPTKQEQGELPATSAALEGPATGRKLATTTLIALGVVFGDIGTSPLYAMRECFAESSGLGVDEANVLGLLSLIIWSLVLVISVKYLSVVMRADNRGEGGILALMALVDAKARRQGRVGAALVAMGVFGAALLFGDGMITPAISVLGAVEGLEIATPELGTFVVPITVVILLGLFAFQRKGTTVVGTVFGPVVGVWFLVIGTLGVLELVHAPGVLLAAWPGHAVTFMVAHPVQGFFALGAVFLTVTGGEALFADIGHFGSRPIRVAWYGLVLPSLLANYLGQGALLLRDPQAVTSPFYHLAPSWAVYPLVGLAAATTVFASQAIISGAFSLARQAVHLGYSPRLEIQHASPEEEGRVYIGSINWVLGVGSVVLVIGFGSSSALAGAYGVAVSMTMVITTLLLVPVMRDIWGLSRAAVIAITTGFLLVDLPFLGANLGKIPDGGWVPLLVAMVVHLLMATFHRGSVLVGRQEAAEDRSIETFWAQLPRDRLAEIDGTAVFLTRDANGTPSALRCNIEHNRVLHRQTIVLTVQSRPTSRVPEAQQIEAKSLGDGGWHVQIFHGFMQPPRVPQLLRQACAEGLELDEEPVTYFVGAQHPISTPKPGMAQWRERLFSAMVRNADSVIEHFGLPCEQVVELSMPIEI